MRKTPVIIELAGLPGAGKSSLCAGLAVPHIERRDIAMTRLQPGRDLWRFASAAMRLCFTTRPLSLNRLGRAVEIVTVTRHYRRDVPLPVVIDQGLAQKLWSMLIETQTHSEPALAAAVAALRPFAPDVLVWIEVPPEVTAQRIAARRDGKSRFDALDPGEIAHRLEPLRTLYQTILDLFARRTATRIVRLDGMAPLEVNAERLAGLCRNSGDDDIAHNT